MTFVEAAITFRRISEADLPMLAEWLRRPHVREWWGPPEEKRAIEELRAVREVVTPDGPALLMWME